MNDNTNWLDKFSLIVICFIIGFIAGVIAHHKYECNTSTTIEKNISIDSLTIVSDSMYVIGCVTKGWKRKKNVKLWEEFDRQYSRVKELCPKIEFIHVRGHQKDDSELAKWNNYVDKLAVNASKQIGQ